MADSCASIAELHLTFGLIMKNIFIVTIVMATVGCTKKAATLPHTNIPLKELTLFCGQIHYGCEDVNTDTLTLHILNRNKIDIIRQYHQSDLPLTSAFVGKFISDKEISATFDRKLTEKNWKQVQDKFPQGDILLTLTCSDFKTYQGCKVSGKAVGETIAKFSGWTTKDSAPENLPCNLKEVKSTRASEKDCQQSE